MRVYVLGAGASAHAGHPLTCDLGATLIRWAEHHPHPDSLTWPTKEELEREFENGCDVESVFTALQVGKRTVFQGRLRDMICECFDAITESRNADLYKRLVRVGVEAGDIVITFNYDVSIELALREVGKWDLLDGYGFRIGDAARPSSLVRVLKLHESTSWLDLVVPGAHEGFRKSDPTAEGYGPRPSILPNHFKMFGYPDDVRDPFFVGGAPVRDGCMILPAADKNFEIRKEFWDGLWRQAEDALRDARQIVTLGYSMPVSDERARNLVLCHGGKGADVICCCRERNNELLELFRRNGFRSLSAQWDFETWLDELEMSHRSTAM